MSKKAYRDLERIIKGLANHHRIRVADLLAKEPELSVAEISERMAVDYKTIAEHLRKLALAGLVMKRHDAAAVRHRLTARGKDFLKFCRTLE